MPESLVDRLFYAYRRVRRGPTVGQLSRLFRIEGLRMEESDVMVALLPHGRRVGALAQVTEVENANLIRTLRALTARGLVARHTDDSDRRASIVELTSAGRPLAELTKVRRKQFIGEVLRYFPGEEGEILINNLEKLNDVLKDIVVRFQDINLDSAAAQLATEARTEPAS